MSLGVAMAVELATAYVSLVAETKGLAKSITSGTSGLDSQLDKRGSALGAGLIGGLTAGLVGPALQLGGKLVSALTTPLTKGFDRLVAIDNAEAKLRGLGQSAEDVEAIMGNALAAVKGTAFGLDAAAGTAGTLVAAGIKPGQDLERILRMVADGATIAGTDMGDMGAIFGKVAANGKLTGEVMQQMMDRQIGVLPKLAEMYGVTNEEAQKMVSEGKVSFEDFAQVMENTLGGAALSSGDTFKGAMANLQASFGRIGANFLRPLFEQLAPTLTALTSAFGPLEEIAGGLGEKVGQFLVPVFEGLRAVLSSGFDFSPFAELLGYLSPLGLAFKVLQPVLPLVMDSLGQIAAVVGGALSQVLQVVLPILGQLVQLFSDVLATILPPLMPLITTLATVLGDLLTALLPLLEPFFQIIQAVLPPLAQGLAWLTPIITTVVDALASLLVPAVELVTGVLGGFITFITGVFSQNWEQAWDGITTVFEAVWNGVSDIFHTIVNGWIDAINGFLGMLGEVGNFVSDITGGAIGFSVPTIPHLADGATVQPRRGGTLAVLAEAGRAESVVDTGLLNRALEQGISGRSTGQPVEMNVWPSPGMDEAAIGRVAAERLNYALRG